MLRLKHLGRIKNWLLGLVLIFGLTASSFPAGHASAAQVTGRKITLSDSTGTATGVTYAFTSSAVPTTATAVKSVGIQFCTAATGTCTAPTGFSTASSTLASQPTGLGAASGWTVNAATTNQLRILNAANATTPSGAVAISWNAVVNPTANNTTFYGLITTYSDSAWTTPIDTGTVALSTAAQIQVALDVSEVLTFCTGTSITGQNCGTISGSSVALGNGSTVTPNSGTSVFAVSTNATTGYSVTVNGATLTSGANTILALASQTASSAGTSQFGLNLKANTTPSVGANVTGTGSATATSNYGTADQFRFVTGDSIASATAPTNANAFTVSYLANIAGTTAPGHYVSTLTYIATANF